MPNFTKFLTGQKKAENPKDKDGVPATLKLGGSLVTESRQDARPKAIDSQARDRYLIAANSAAKAGYAPGRKGHFAILLDATGSMNNLLDAARRSLVDIIDRLQAEAGVSVTIKIIAYRDYDDGDDLLALSPVESSAQPLISWLNGITARGGGDAPEAVEAALGWVLQDGEFDAVLVAGDAPSHSRENLLRKGKAQSRTSHELSLEFGRKKIPIHTFVVGNCQETVADFEVIARNSGGQTGRLDGSEAMRDMAVMAMLERLKGRGAVKAYMERHNLLLGPAASFGNALLLEHRG